MRAIVFGLVFASSLFVETSSLTGAQDASGESVADQVGQIQLQLNEWLDLHASVRFAIERGQAVEADLFQAAIDAGEQAEAAWGTSMVWGVIEGALAGADDAVGVREALRSLPKEYPLGPTKRVDLRDPAVSYGEALIAAHAESSEAGWRSHESVLRQVKAELQPILDRHWPAMVTMASTHLGLSLPVNPLLVYLVHDAPSPGGITVRTAKGPVCIVGVGKFGGSTRIEAIVHECLHVLDVNTAGPQSILNRLRAGMREGGLAPSHPMMRDLPHTLMFVESAECVRQVFEPGHVDYGDSAGYYARVGSAADIVRANWRTPFSSQEQLNRAVSEMVQAAAAADSTLIDPASDD